MKLSTDNPDTMPITDAVYGNRSKRKVAQYDPRGHYAPLWRRLSQWELDLLAKLYPKARRKAAQKRSEGGSR